MSEHRRSPLHDRHVAAGAKLVPFGGWDMPVAYPDGTLAEHMACRQGAAVFDVSHLGTVRVSGPGAFDALQYAFTNDLDRIEPGRAQYTHLVDPESAGVLDDLIVWWIDATTFDVMPNASNTERVVAALDGSGVEIDDVTHTRAVLAVQGPEARSLLGTISAEAAAVGRFRIGAVRWSDVDLVVAGTGYTGEDGVEIAVPAGAAARLWDAVVAAGVTPAGLGARDTLRLEAGFPLHGHELGPDIDPFEADLGWVVRFDKGDFRGRAALEDARDRRTRRSRGLVTEGRRPPRDGSVVLRGGQQVGVVTSGNYSPVLGHGIALALLDVDLDEGQPLTVDVRGTELDARIVDLPFHRS